MGFNITSEFNSIQDMGVYRISISNSFVIVRASYGDFRFIRDRVGGIQYTLEYSDGVISMELPSRYSLSGYDMEYIVKEVSDILESGKLYQHTRV